MLRQVPQFILTFVITAGCVWAQDLATREASHLYLRAYQSLKQGDRLKKDDKRVAQYETAVSHLENLKTNYPTFQKGLVAFRLDYCRKLIKLLHAGKIATNQQHGEAKAMEAENLLLAQALHEATTRARMGSQAITQLQKLVIENRNLKRMLTARNETTPSPKNKELERALAELVKVQNEKDAEVSVIKAKLKAAEAMLRELREELRDSSLSNLEKDRLLKQQKPIIDAFNKQIRLLNAEIKLNKKQLSKRTDQLVKSTQLSERGQKEIAQLHKTLASLEKGDISELKKLVADQRSLLLEQQKLLEAERARTKEWIGKARNIQMELDVLQAANKDLRGILKRHAQNPESALAKEFEQLSNALQDQLKAANADLHVLRGKLEDQLGFNLDLKRRLQEATGKKPTEIAALTKALGEKTNDLRLQMMLCKQLEQDKSRLTASYEQSQALLKQALAETELLRSKAKTARTANAQDVDENQVQILLQQARAAQKLGRAKQAIQHFENAIKLGPTVECLQTYADFCLSTRDYPKATELAAQAFRLNPSDIVTCRLLSKCHALTGRTSSAAGVLLYANGLSPSPTTGRQLARLLRELKWFHAAEAELKASWAARQEAATAKEFAFLYSAWGQKHINLAKQWYSKSLQLGEDKEPQLEKFLNSATSTKGNM